MDAQVKKTFSSYPEHIREKMLELRSLIYEVAEQCEQVEFLSESLKWGEPSYVPSKPRTGTPIRLGWKKENPHQIGVYVNCRTTLIKTFRKQFNEQLHFEGTRAIMLDAETTIPRTELAIFFKAALQYHSSK
jgi:hypothetical protein